MRQIKESVNNTEYAVKRRFNLYPGLEDLTLTTGT